MVILLRCKDLDTDSRALKYVDFYRRKGIDYKIVSWDRLNQSSFDENTINFNYKSSYNQGGWNAVKDRLKWMRFVVKSLRRISSNRQVIIHACDLDTAFPAVIFKMLFSRRSKVIFDVFDWYSATLANQNKVIRAAFALMERISVKYSDHIIICEEERIEQIPYEIKDGSLSVLPNIPSFETGDFLVEKDEYRFDNEKLTLSYVGGLYNQRCLDELIDIAEEGRINLLIAGFGDKRLEERLNLLDKPNVKYFGRVRYDVGQTIMFNADVIYAMYSKENPNHFYAAPNKYYETMFLGKAIISTAGINMEKKIRDNAIGYSCEEDKDSIVKLIESISRDDLKKMGENAAKLWTEEFSTFTEDYLNSTYIGLISDNS